MSSHQTRNTSTPPPDDGPNKSGSTDPSDTPLSPQQQRLQQMVNMQHAQQASLRIHGLPRSSSGGSGGMEIRRNPSSNAAKAAAQTPAAAGSIHYQSYEQQNPTAGSPHHSQPGGGGQANVPAPVSPSVTAPLLYSARETTTAGAAPPPPPTNHQEGVGRGVLYQSSSTTEQLSLPYGPMPNAAPTNGPDEMEGGRGGGGYYDHTAMPPRYTYQLPLSGAPSQQQPPHYGTATADQQQLPQQQQHISIDNLHEHQFHYGNPDRVNPYFPDHYSTQPTHHRKKRHSIWQALCCCCLSRCILNAIRHLKNAENLHRSFCFGAIDGTLTGSGITAACAGLGFLHPNAPLVNRLTVVALSLAACTSDGICMALGHVWSTYVLQNASVKERREEKENFHKNRADAKGKLVDLLLSRGMLKIDAMSVADTLEGYPHIFVSALVGDSGYALGADDGDGHHTMQRVGSGAGVLGIGAGHGWHLNPEDGDFGHGHYPVPVGKHPAPHHHVPLGQQEQPRGLYHRSDPAYQSYGQFDEYRDDPDAAGLAFAVGEARNEGFVMMFSFTLFSIVPSLVYTGITYWIPDVSGSLEPDGGGMSSTSMVVCALSAVMVLLGIWKSKFFDSSWIVFGIETVLVLLLCLASAFFIGAGMAKLIGSPASDVI